MTLIEFALVKWPARRVIRAYFLLALVAGVLGFGFVAGAVAAGYVTLPAKERAK